MHGYLPSEALAVYTNTPLHPLHLAFLLPVRHLTSPFTHPQERGTMQQTQDTLLSALHTT